MQLELLSFRCSDDFRVIHETNDQRMPWIDVELSKPAGTRKWPNKCNVLVEVLDAHLELI